MLRELLSVIIAIPLILIGVALLALSYEVWLLVVFVQDVFSNLKNKCRNLSKRKV